MGRCPTSLDLFLKGAYEVANVAVGVACFEIYNLLVATSA
jgi:hypothetical protein